MATVAMVTDSMVTGTFAMVAMDTIKKISLTQVEFTSHDCTCTVNLGLIAQFFLTNVISLVFVFQVSITK